jgi:hypothetical protein
MLKHALFALLLFSLSFSVVGSQCHDLEKYCKEKSCTTAGGEINDYNTCSKPEGFNKEVYQEELDNCQFNYEYCLENDGMAKDMTCCGPMFIFLFALLGLYADGTQ